MSFNSSIDEDIDMVCIDLTCTSDVNSSQELEYFEQYENVNNITGSSAALVSNNTVPQVQEDAIVMSSDSEEINERSITRSMSYMSTSSTESSFSTAQYGVDDLLSSIRLYPIPKVLTQDDITRSIAKNGGQHSVGNPLLIKKFVDNSSENYPEAKKFIKANFLVDMPEDFYDFWEYCKYVYPSNPANALRGVGCMLCGPFDVLAGKFNNGKLYAKEQFLTHWRYYYDPPEFQTIIRRVNSAYHFGYFRDDPNSTDCIVAGYDQYTGCVLTALGDNIFAAVKVYLEANVNSMDPNARLVGENIPMDLKTKYLESKSRIESRKDSIVCPTFHKLGLVVPLEQVSKMGYRDLPASYDYMRSVFNDIATATTRAELKEAVDCLRPLVNAAHVANVQYDYGAALELSINIFCSGNLQLNKILLYFSKTAYRMIDRVPFFEILQAHLSNRKNGPNLSMLQEEDF